MKIKNDARVECGERAFGPAPGSKVATSPNNATKGHGTMRHSNRSSALRHTAIITGPVLAVTVALFATTTFAAPPPSTTLTLYTCLNRAAEIKTFNSNDTQFQVAYDRFWLIPVEYNGSDIIDIWRQGGTQVKCGTSDGCIFAVDPGDGTGSQAKLYNGTLMGGGRIIPANSEGYVVFKIDLYGTWVVPRVLSTDYNCREYLRDHP